MLLALHQLLGTLGESIEDPVEECFYLFSQDIPSQNLGFVDSKASTIELSIGDRDLTIHQSPTVLSSNRERGTTGAVLWKITPLLADWMSSPQNVLFQTSILSTNSIVLELGCGISGLVGMLLAPMVNRYIATDQDYVFKLLKQNLSENTQSFGTNPHRKRKSKHARGKQSTDTQQKTQASNVDVMALDWELDSTSTLLDFLSSSPTNLDTIDSTHLDAVIACDCIYNEALVDPFVRTCAEICGLSRTQTNSPRTPVCIVAQQLRSSDVFEAWLTAFHKKFRIWRIPDELLTEGLREGSGFVIHVGVLRRSE